MSRVFHFFMMCLIACLSVAVIVAVSVPNALDKAK